MNLLILLIPILFSLQHISVRIGSERSETLNGIYASLLVSTVLFSPSILNPTINGTFIFYMSIAGILQFFFARICLYLAISRIGANLSAPLSATRIFFATIFGVFLGEMVTLNIILASILIFVGIFLISRAEKRRDYIGITLAVLTGFFASLSSYFIKFGNSIDYNPVFASFLGFAISTLLLTPIMRGRSLRYTKIFALGGVLGAIAHLIRYMVLKYEPVTVVEPITSTHPLFTLFFTAAFLREKEVFTFRSIFGTFAVIIGIYFLILLK